MSELDKALADIEAIRSRMASGTVFRGFGPTALVTTAGVALLTAMLQVAFPPAQLLTFFIGWILAAVVCVALIGAETFVRSGRAHGRLGDAMLHQAIQHFLPAGAGGAAFALVVARVSPESAWMLPGVWQVLVGLGVFAASPSLPRGAVLAGAWYFVSGFAVMMMLAGQSEISPWSMAIPFAVGQTILACVVHRAFEGDRYAQS